jgi:CDP-diacylglycerol--serine O-phosphatidyltransferase
MKITRAVVPSLFTVLNMFCGFLSIVQSSMANPDFTMAGWFILMAGVFDTLDGFMARLTKSASQFGVEIDSLSDVVSFGVAPAFLVYKLHLFQFETLGLIISSLLMILGGIRLARFNVQLVGFDKEHFTGLPIPASAITVVAYVFAFRQDNAGLVGLPADALGPLVVILSLLMVSKIKYDTLPKLSKKGIKKHPIWSSSILLGAVLLVVTKGMALFYLCSLFILWGILRWTWQAIHMLLSAPEVEPSDDAEEAASVDI